RLGLVLLIGMVGAAPAWAAQTETPKSVTRAGAVKIALLTAAGVGEARNVLDVALVKLSDDKGLTLLERVIVDRALREQKLSLGGLVDANGWRGMYVIRLKDGSASAQEIKSASKGTPRLALVGANRNPEIANLLTLAEVKLSAGADVEILDRNTVDRVLAEQKLSLSGFVKSDQVLQ